MLREQRLIGGLSPTKCEETYAVMIEADLGANETMRPVGIDWKTSAEQRNRTVIVGVTNEDDGAGGMGAQIE